MSTTVKHSSPSTHETNDSTNHSKNRGGRKTWLSLTFRILATLALVGFVLQRVEWESLVSLLKSLQWQWFAAGQAIAIAIQVVAGIRWSALARPIALFIPLVFLYGDSLKVSFSISAFHLQLVVTCKSVQALRHKPWPSSRGLHNTCRSSCRSLRTRNISRISTAVT